MAADVVMGAAIRFSLQMKLLPERSEFLAYAERLGQRPALQRTLAQEAELPPRQQQSPGKEI